MTFDPDQYLKENQDIAFDPDQYLKDLSKSEEISKLETIKQIVGRDLPFGFGEEVGAAIRAIPTYAKQLITPNIGKELAEGTLNIDQLSLSPELKEKLKTRGITTIPKMNIAPKETKEETFGDIYRGYRDVTREKNKLVEEANPKIATMTSIGTSFIPTIGLAGKAIAGGKKAYEAAKGVGKAVELLKATGKGVARGAVLGGVQGLGSSEADLTRGELDKAAEDIKSGAEVGAVVGGALPAAGAIAKPAIGKAGEIIKGIYRSISDPFRKIADTGLSTAKGQNPFGSIKKTSADIEDNALKLGKIINDFDTKTFNEIGEILSPKQTFNFNPEINKYKQRLVEGLEWASPESELYINSIAKKLDKITPETNVQGMMNFEKGIAELISAAPGNSKAILSSLRKEIRDDLTKKISDMSGPEAANKFTKLYEQRKMMHDIKDQLPNDFVRATDSDTDILDKFLAQTKELSGYGSKEAKLAITGGKTSQGKELSGLKQKIESLLPESKSVLENIQDQQKLLALKQYGQSADSLTGWFKQGARYVSGAAGALARPVVAVAQGTQEVLEKSGEAIRKTAQNQAAKGNLNIAEFLNNFSNADITKKKAMAFSASQNPELRNFVNKPEQSENQE